MKTDSSMHWVTITGIILIFLGTFGTYWGQNLQAKRNVKKEILRSNKLIGDYITSYEELISQMNNSYNENKTVDSFPFAATSSILLEITDFENGRLSQGKHRKKLNDDYFKKQKRIYDSIKYSFLKIDFDNYPELGTLFSDYIVYLETSDPEKTHEIINDDIKTRLVDPKNQSIIRQPAQFYVLNKAQDYKKLPPAFSPYLRIYDNINYHIDFFKKYRKLIDKL